MTRSSTKLGGILRKTVIGETDRFTGGWTDRRTDRLKNRQADRKVGRRADRFSGQTDGETGDEWTGDEWTGEQTDRQINRSTGKRACGQTDKQTV